MKESSDEAEKKNDSKKLGGGVGKGLEDHEKARESGGGKRGAGSVSPERETFPINVDRGS